MPGKVETGVRALIIGGLLLSGGGCASVPGNGETQKKVGGEEGKSAQVVDAPTATGFVPTRVNVNEASPTAVVTRTTVVFDSATRARETATKTVESSATWEPTATPEPTVTSEPTAEVTPGAKVVSGGLNVRSGPGTNFEIVGGKAHGDTMEVLGIVNGWAKVRFEDDSEGWVIVSNKYVELNEKVAALPPLDPSEIPATPTVRPTARIAGVSTPRPVSTSEKTQEMPATNEGLPDTPPKPYVHDENSRDGYLNSMSWYEKEYRTSMHFFYYQGKFLGWRVEGNNILVRIDIDKNPGGEKEVIYYSGTGFKVSAIRGGEVDFFATTNSLETIKKAMEKYFLVGDPIKLYIAPENSFPDGSAFKIVTFR